MVWHDGSGQLEAENQFPCVAVDFRGCRAGAGIDEIPPRLIPPAAGRSTAMDADMDMLGNEEGELMDVGHAS
jgi:hypothetical protein